MLNLFTFYNIKWVYLKLKYLLKELSRGGGGVWKMIQSGDWSAVRCVPLITAAGPRQFGLKRCYEIINSPADDCVIMHPHVDIEQTYRVSDTC